MHRINDKSKTKIAASAKRTAKKTSMHATSQTNIMTLLETGVITPEIAQTMLQHQRQQGDTMLMRANLVLQNTMGTGNPNLVEKAKKDHLAFLESKAKEELKQMDTLVKMMEKMGPPDAPHLAALKKKQQAMQALFDMSQHDQQIDKTFAQNPLGVLQPGALSGMQERSDAILNATRQFSQTYRITPDPLMALLPPPNAKKTLLIAPTVDLNTQITSIPKLLEKAQRHFDDKAYDKAEVCLLNAMIFWINEINENQKEKIKELALPNRISEWRVSAINDWLLKSLQHIQHLKITSDQLIAIIQLIMLHIDTLQEKMAHAAEAEEENEFDFLFMNNQLSQFIAVGRYLVENHLDKTHEKHTAYMNKLNEITTHVSLRYTVWQGDETQVDEILNSSPAETATAKGFMGRSLLMIAAEKGYRGIIIKLIHHGANVMQAAETPEGNNLLFYAVRHLTILLYLVKRYPHLIQMRNKQDKTIIQLIERDRSLRLSWLHLIRLSKKRNRTARVSSKTKTLPSENKAETVDSFDTLFDEASTLVVNNAYPEAIQKIKRAFALLDANSQKTPHTLTQRYHAYQLLYKTQMAAGHYQDSMASAEQLLTVITQLDRKQTDPEADCLVIATFVAAVAKEDTGQVKQLLLETSANPTLRETLVNATGKNHNTVLMLAYAQQDKSHEQLQRLLLNASRKLDIKAQNDLQQSVLHQLAITGSTEMIAIIVNPQRKRSYDIDQKDHLGRTPLHYACLQGQKSCVKQLLKLNASIDAVDDTGNTPLALAKLPAIRSMLQARKSLSTPATNQQNNKNIKKQKGAKTKEENQPDHAQGPAVKINDVFRLANATMKKLRAQWRAGSESHDKLIPDIEEAVEQLETALHHTENKLRVYLKWMTLCYLNQEWDQHARLVNEAITLFPDDVELKLQHAHAKRVNHESASAEAKYNDVLKQLSTLTPETHRIKKLKIRALEGLYKVTSKTQHQILLSICDQILALDARNLFATTKRKITLHYRKKSSKLPLTERFVYRPKSKPITPAVDNHPSQAVASLESSLAVPLSSTTASSAISQPAMPSEALSASTTTSTTTTDSQASMDTNSNHLSFVPNEKEMKEGEGQDNHFEQLREEAWMYFNMGHYSQAQALFQRLQPLDEALSYFGLGRCAEAMKQFDQAITDYNNAIAIDNEYYPAHLHQVVLLSKISTEPLQVHHARFEALTHQFKTEPESYLQHAIYLSIKGYAIQGLIKYETTVEKFPFFTKAHIALVNHYMHMKLYNKAVNHCKHFLKLKIDWLAINIPKTPRTEQVDLSLDYSLYLAYIRITLSLSKIFPTLPSHLNAYYGSACAAAVIYSKLFYNNPYAIQQLQFIFISFRLPIPVPIISLPQPAIASVSAPVEATGLPQEEKSLTSPPALGETPQELLFYLFYHAQNNQPLTNADKTAIHARKKTIWEISSEEYNDLYNDYFLTGYAKSFYQLLSDPAMTLDDELFPNVEDITDEQYHRNKAFIEYHLDIIDQRFRAGEEITCHELFAIFMAKELFEEKENYHGKLTIVIEKYSAPFDINDALSDGYLYHYVTARIAWEQQYQLATKEVTLSASATAPPMASVPNAPQRLFHSPTADNLSAKNLLAQPVKTGQQPFNPG